MKRASIDIGTNSVLLLVADFTDGSLTVLDERQAVPRLGKGVDSDGQLSDESMERVLTVLKEYKEHLDDHFPEVGKQVIVTATSAVRDAANRESFLNRIKEETGWSVRLISGDEEAQITWCGALSVLEPSNEPRTVIDIGGGSTEVISGTLKGIEQAVSIDMGSVRFSERFLSDPGSVDNGIRELRKTVRELLQTAGISTTASTLVGVAGTVTSVAAIRLGLNEYQPAALNGYALQRASVKSFIQEFSGMTGREIEERYPLFLKGRGDVILGGLLILDEFMNWRGHTQIMVSTGGMRHGSLLIFSEK